MTRNHWSFGIVTAALGLGIALFPALPEPRALVAEGADEDAAPPGAEARGEGETETPGKGAVRPRGRAVTFEPAPGAKGRVTSLPRGEVLLYEVLQGLADASGGTVEWAGTEPPQTKLLLERAVDPLDAALAMKVLEGAGFRVEKEVRKGKPIYRVEKGPPPPRKKGRIIREGEAKDSRERDQAPADEPRPAGAAGAGSPARSIRLYEMQEGTGSRYVVIVETDSRTEAEEAVSLLKAHRRSREAR